MQPRASTIPLLWDEEASLRATTRQGQPLVKILEDLLRYRKIIEQTKPDLIVECGTWRGASAAWFHEVSGADVITVDVQDWIDDDTTRQNLARAGVTRVVGSSTDDDIFRDVYSLRHDPVKQYSRVMVVLDSDHTAAHVREEIERYQLLVSPGCYLVVEDGHASFFADFPDGGPLEAIEAWQNAGGHAEEFIRDTDIEADSPVTLHPAGFWIRK
jgi:cephalosporin hydroxylase